jgi:hypothetical protein
MINGIMNNVKPNIPSLSTNNSSTTPVNNYTINVDKIQSNDAKSLLSQLTGLVRSS